MAMWTILWPFLLCLAQAKLLGAKCPEIPETLTALDWYDLRDSPEFFRCLHDLKSEELLLVGLYFASAAQPEEVLVKDAPKLGGVWLNPGVEEHHLLYKLGKLRRHVVAKGVDLKAEQFQDAALCATNLSTRCSVMEISPDDLPCLGPEASPEKCKARLAELVLQLQASEKAHGVGTAAPSMAFCAAARLIVGRGPQELVLWLKGYQQAQCALSSCVLTGTNLNYAKLYACHLGGQQWTTLGAFILLLVYCFLIIGVVADGYLIPALCQIGRHLEMSDAMLGATLLALGGSITDFMTGLVSVLSLENDQPDVSLWLGGLVGAGLFANTVVVSLVPLCHGDASGAQMDAMALSRDLGFRSLANVLVITFACLGYFNAFLGFVMTACYVIYVLKTLRETSKTETQANPANPCTDAPPSVTEDLSFISSSFGRRKSLSFQAHAGSLVLTHVSGEDVAVEMCSQRLKRHFAWNGASAGVMEKVNFFVALPFRPFFCLTMATVKWDPVVNVLMPCCVCLFLPFGNPLGNSYKSPGQSSILLIQLLAVVGLLMSIKLGLLARGRPGHYIGFIGFQWITFVSALLWIGLLAGEIVGAFTVLGGVVGMSPTTMGLTLLAFGNTVDNVFATMGLVKNGQSAVAITGVYAADTFTMFCVCGCIMLLLCVKTGQAVPVRFTACAMTLLIVIQVILGTTWIWTKQNQWKMPKALGKFLLACYPSALILGFLLEYIRK